MRKQKTQKGGPNGGRRAGGRKPPRELIPHPPMIRSYAIEHGVRLRFTVNAAAAGAAITYQNLLDTIVTASTALQLYDLFTAVRVRRISVWALPVLGAASTVEVLFTGTTAGSAGSDKVVTDTSMGIEPAHVRASPGRNTLASMYQQSSAAVAFQITVPVGAVVDMELSFKNNPGLAVPAQNASVGAIIGAVQYRGLDGLAAATTKFTPGVQPAI